MVMMNVPHSPAFFAQMRTCREPYRLLADCFHEVLVPRLRPAPSGTSGTDENKISGPASTRDKHADPPLTAIDVGCGVGCQTARLAELGWTIAGFDVFDVSPEPGFAFRNLDLLEVPARLKYDVAICTETAEHVAPERADKLVLAVASRAKKSVVWSSAPPGTEWEGHVNCQPAEYWLEKFSVLGWVPDLQKTTELRRLILERRAQHWMAVNTFFVLGAAGQLGRRNRMRDYRDLVAFKLSDKVVLSTYKATKTFPKEELFGLTSQMRRAAVSVSSNIVEGCSRSGDRELARFLTIAYASARELSYQVSIAQRLEYGELTPLAAECDESARVLWSFLQTVTRSLPPA